MLATLKQDAGSDNVHNIEDSKIITNPSLDPKKLNSCTIQTRSNTKTTIMFCRYCPTKTDSIKQSLEVNFQGREVRLGNYFKIVFK